MTLAESDNPSLTQTLLYLDGVSVSFDGYEALTCADDDEAIGTIRCLTDTSAIELWTGERFVTRLERKSR